MMLLQVKSVLKYIGARKILEDISFTINKGQRVGLVGLNGCGKSTLFKLIAGEEKSDSGEIVIMEKIKSGYLPQGFSDFHQSPQKSVRDFLFEPTEAYLNRLKELETLMENSLSIAESENYLSDYGKILGEFEDRGGYLYGEKLEYIFEKLRMDDCITTESNLSFLKLSGGQRLKLALARILASDPDLLLLDEPTNYLDLQSLLWLENFLLNFKGGSLVISHDRRFLDKIVTGIFELSILDGRLKGYGGNYSYYKEQKEKEREKHWEKYRDQQDKISQIRHDIRQTKNYALKTEESTVNDFLRGKAKKVAQKARAREKRLERMLSEENRIDKPWTLEHVRIKLDTDTKKGKSLLSIRDAGFTLPDGRPLFCGVNMELSCGDRVVIMGPNGAGKGTFMKIAAGKLNLSSGEVIAWPGTITGYLPQDEADELRLDRTVIEEFRDGIMMEEGDARTFLHRMLFKGEDVFKNVGLLSYGERVKLLLVKLMASGVNTLLLDEPTSHLDTDSMDGLEKALVEFPGGLMVITHDRYFMEKLNIRNIYVFNDGKFLHYESYREYEEEICTLL